jgi:hypothetical protein
MEFDCIENAVLEIRRRELVRWQQHLQQAMGGKYETLHSR